MSRNDKKYIEVGKRDIFLLVVRHVTSKGETRSLPFSVGLRRALTSLKVKRIMVDFFLAWPNQAGFISQSN